VLVQPRADKVLEGVLLGLLPGQPVIVLADRCLLIVEPQPVLGGPLVLLRPSQGGAVGGPGDVAERDPVMSPEAEAIMSVEVEAVMFEEPSMTKESVMPPEVEPVSGGGGDDVGGGRAGDVRGGGAR
jgi:hypothetical protein